MTPEIQRLGEELRQAVTTQTIAQHEASVASEISKAKSEALNRAQQAVWDAHGALQQAVRQHFLPSATPSMSSVAFHRSVAKVELPDGDRR